MMDFEFYSQIKARVVRSALRADVVLNVQPHTVTEPQGTSGLH